VTLDFKDLHEPKCKGVEKPGEVGSDYELWSPYDGRHGEKCFMGQQISYVRRLQDSECFNGEELERKVFKQYCTCTEMDYECDLGYYRTSSLTSCTKDENFPKEELEKEKEIMCEQFGWYPISKGYRRIPNNRCIEGVDLAPDMVICSISGHFTLWNSFLLFVVLGVLFLAKPVFEACVLVLPIPDPKDILEKLGNIFSKDNIPNITRKPATKKGYSHNFNQAPESLEEDDDENDIGKNMNLGGSGLSYDSDEDKDGQSELINLNSDVPSTRDRTGSAASNVPKLNRPE
jgi:hypothetical protein